MDKLLPAEKAKVKVDFTKFYSTVISYIEKWFDLSTDNVMMKLRPIGLFETLRFSDLEEVAAALKLTDTLNMDKLYEEFCASQEEIETARQDPQKSTSEKWVSVFQKVGKANLTNLFQIVSFVLSVPGSNAFVERIFSLMANKWSSKKYPWKNK
ncbi:30S ribosomal protein S12 [Dissostichus eleginoides]|uniref:30S ribosomal protein S12 n=1 Tax=Dissostichus eleginoides TaxID=100907 RepID=A0AAD9FHW5_DISEL|nr:30S ribosomal protein S12 [Dissostichus eleginoides]